MDRKIFMVWLREHGFKRQKFDVYEAVYQGETIRVEVSKAIGRTTLSVGGSPTLVHRYELLNLFHDNFDMVQGAGLTEYFAERVLFGEPFPKWFTPDFLWATRARFAREAQLTAAKEWPKFDEAHVPERSCSIVAGEPGKRQIASWLLQQGFSQVGDYAFEAKFNRERVRLSLTDFGVQTSRITSAEKEIISNAQYRSINVDSNGMLRQAGLVSPFIDDVLDGAGLPIWFTDEFVDAHASGLEAAGVDVANAYARPHAPSQRLSF
jgi:hypothetical protein